DLAPRRRSALVTPYAVGPDHLSRAGSADLHACRLGPGQGICPPELGILRIPGTGAELTRRGKSRGAALVRPRGSAREGEIDAPQLMLRSAASQYFTLGPGWLSPWLPGGPGFRGRRAGRWCRGRGRW